MLALDNVCVHCNIKYSTDKLSKLYYLKDPVRGHCSLVLLYETSSRTMAIKSYLTGLGNFQQMSPKFLSTTIRAKKASLI